MPYKGLYTLRQNIDSPSLDLSWFVEQANLVTWAESISLKRTDAFTDEYICGFIVRRLNRSNHGLTSHYQVITTKSLDAIKEKMVTIKELMHIYRPDAVEQNATEIALDNSMRQFFGHSGVTPSFAVLSEYKAIWMALGLICPEHIRKTYLSRINDNADAFGIEQAAKELEVSTHHARLIFSDQYLDEIAAFLN